LSFLDDLIVNAQPALCHGDASTWNVLAAGSNKWTLIDPRGVCGEVAYDVAVLALKIARGESADVDVDRLVERSGAEPARVQAWALIADAARV
jgi:streptomycin 6-kinase